MRRHRIVLVSVCAGFLALTTGAIAQLPVHDSPLLNVDPRLPWTPTGTFVGVGDTVTVFCMGAYTNVPPPYYWSDLMGPNGGLLCDPTFPVPYAPIGCLIARIGFGVPFPIGEFAIFVAETEGELEFGTNNIDFDSNDGMLKVNYGNKLSDTTPVPPVSGAFGTMLRQNSPNPFNPSTTIRFSIAEATHVELSIYTAAGGFVRSLVSEARPAGEYRVAWDGRDADGKPMPSGAYFYELKVGDSAATRKMILVK